MKSSDKSFGERFIQSEGKSLHWEGEEVHMSILVDVSDGSILELERLKHQTQAIEGLQLRSKGGVLMAAGQTTNDVTYWSDAAPSRVEVSFRKKPSKKDSSVRIWNIWRRSDEVVHAWIGNAGMIIDRIQENEWILRCSDGIGEPNFDDLVVRLRKKPGEPHEIFGSSS